MQKQDSSDNFLDIATSFIHHTDRNLFLTGRAGTGKTTFLKKIMESTRKKSVVVAPTGVAAINAGGVTIHSFFQMPLGTYIPNRIKSWELNSHPAFDKAILLKNIRISNNKRKLFEELELLIIDEISMVRADLLDAVDVVLKYFRRNQHDPFGGVQVLMIGDLFQLPPVVVNQEWNLLSAYYQSPFFFDSQVLRQSPPLSIELQRIYRQSDVEFIGLLNRIRNNRVTNGDLTWLDTFYKPYFRPSKEDNYITLTSHNYIADKINERELNSLSGKKHNFRAIVEGTFHEKTFPAEDVLQLKTGAQIMFIKNDKGEFRRYYNGKIGIVKDIDEDDITIGFPNESMEIQLEREEWTNIRYHFNEEKKQVEEEVLGSFSQYPIRLAWAITIHKSQGLTFDKAIIDAGASFTAGQVYVALSRLTNINGLVLRSKISKDCIRCDEDVLHFMNNIRYETELKDILKGEQKTFVHKSLVKSFEWGRLINELQQFIQGHEDKQAPISNDAIMNGRIWLEKALEQKMVADKFHAELNRILAQGENGYPKLQERVAAACKYFSKQLKDIHDGIEQHLVKVGSKSKTKKYLKTIRVLQVALNELEGRMKSAVLLAEGMNTGLDSHTLIKKFDEARNTPVIVPVVEVKKAVKGGSQLLSLQMFREGISIKDIALERGLAAGTIEGHLAQFIKTGELSVFDFIPEERVREILPLVEQHDVYASTNIKSILGDDYSYGEIRAVINHYLWMQQKEQESRV
jgi:nucleoside-triphosphatase THEP1